MTFLPLNQFNLKALVNNHIPVELCTFTSSFGHEKLSGIITSYVIGMVLVQETHNISNEVSINSIRSIRLLEGPEKTKITRRLQSVIGSSFGSKPGNSEKSFKPIKPSFSHAELIRAQIEYDNLPKKPEDRPNGGAFSRYKKLSLAQMRQKKKVAEPKPNPQKKDAYAQGMGGTYTVKDLEREMEETLRTTIESPTPRK